MRTPRATDLIGVKWLVLHRSHLEPVVRSEAHMELVFSTPSDGEPHNIQAWAVCETVFKEKETKLLFLDNSGDDMPDNVAKRLGLIEGGINRRNVVIDGNLKVYLWAIDQDWEAGAEVTARALRLWPIGRMRPSNDDNPTRWRHNDAPPLEQIYENLNAKRPFDFSVEWSAVQDYLDKEEDWFLLRQYLQVNIRTYPMWYTAQLLESEETTEW